MEFFKIYKIQEKHMIKTWYRKKSDAAAHSGTCHFVCPLTWCLFLTMENHKFLAPQMTTTKCLIEASANVELCKWDLQFHIFTFWDKNIFIRLIYKMFHMKNIVLHSTVSVYMEMAKPLKRMWFFCLDTRGSCCLNTPTQINVIQTWIYVLYCYGQMLNSDSRL